MVATAVIPCIARVLFAPMWRRRLLCARMSGMVLWCVAPTAGILVRVHHHGSHLLVAEVLAVPQRCGLVRGCALGCVLHLQTVNVHG